jgi:hypothetical protein
MHNLPSAQFSFCAIFLPRNLPAAQSSCRAIFLPRNLPAAYIFLPRILLERAVSFLAFSLCVYFHSVNYPSGPVFIRAFYECAY